MARAFREVAVVAAVRTPIGAFGGSLKSVRGPHLAAAVFKEALKRGGVNPDLVGDVIMGSCLEDYDALNVARIGALVAGLSNKIPAVSINRVCCSAMEAVHTGVRQIQAGRTDVVLAGGVESMSNAYYYLPNMRFGQRLQDGKCCDSIIHALEVGSEFVPYPANGPLAPFRGKKYIMGLTAEFLAAKHQFTRAEQDEVALRSHNLAEAATVEGRFAAEIVPIEVKQKKKTLQVTKDEHFKPGLTAADLALLPPAFIPKAGTVTAGNSSGINDGASCMLLISREKCEELQLKPLAYITGLGSGACAPEFMGESPVPAVQDLCRRTGHSISDYQRVECHEAFASQYLACERGLKLDRSITNVNGSGIGLGHPVGSTGARIMVTLLHEMIRSQKRLGMATLCGGGGVSLATELTLA